MSLPCPSVFIMKTIVATLLVLSSGAVLPAAEGSGLQVTGHSQGNMQINVSNAGTFGAFDFSSPAEIPVDPVHGDTLYGCVYPRKSGILHTCAELRIGAVIGQDTLFAGTAVFRPLPPPLGDFVLESIDRSKVFYSDDARSELDLICEYTDTMSNYYIDEQRHIPTGIRVVQRSMAWSADLVDDFVLVEFHIRNIGRKTIRGMYPGFYCTVPAAHIDNPDGIPLDNLAGIVATYPSSTDCSYTDTFNLTYTIDNDGDPISHQFTNLSALAATGIMLLGTSGETTPINYNWYTFAWGPRKRGTPSDPFRPFSHGYTWPQDDADFYYLFRHREFDYDQVFSALDYTDDGWMPPVSEAAGLARGAFPYTTYSFGPFDLDPGQSMSFTIAIVGGDNVHHDPTAHERLFDPHNPQPFFDQLDFSEFVEHARWAQRVYDNPGVDTDGDGYSGEFRVCEGDTTWYKGDGIPDFSAQTPPPAPFMRVITDLGRLVVRWNGYFSETYIDQFTGQRDFEGYRVYLGLDDRRASLTLQSAWDLDNYLQYKYELLVNGETRWTSLSNPVSPDSLRVLFDNPDLNSLNYTLTHPLAYNGDYYYFAPMGFNQSDLTIPGGIHKVYPDATNPGEDSTLWTDDDVTTDYGQRLPKYYEYEYVIEDLLPSIPYFVAVTAHDYGFKGGSIPSEESKPETNMQRAYAEVSADTVEVKNLDVYVYPNPYRIDAGYSQDGYENRADNVIADRARRIHFANLPNVCVISIYTPDGDLVRKIKHDHPEGGPEAMHETWNLISRNVQVVVSGWYYWVVESDTRTQMGKLVIIK